MFDRVEKSEGQGKAGQDNMRRRREGNIIILKIDNLKVSLLLIDVLRPSSGPPVMCLPLDLPQWAFRPSGESRGGEIRSDEGLSTSGGLRCSVSIYHWHRIGSVHIPSGSRLRGCWRREESIWHSSIECLVGWDVVTGEIGFLVDDFLVALGLVRGTHHHWRDAIGIIFFGGVGVGISSFEDDVSAESPNESSWRGRNQRERGEGGGGYRWAQARDMRRDHDVAHFESQKILFERDWRCDKWGHPRSDSPVEEGEKVSHRKGSKDPSYLGRLWWRWGHSHRAGHNSFWKNMFFIKPISIYEGEREERGGIREEGKKEGGRRGPLKRR
jgi:hypothetical protein